MASLLQKHFTGFKLGCKILIANDLIEFSKFPRLFLKTFFILPLMLCCAYGFSQNVSIDSLFSLAKKSLQQNNYEKAITYYQNCLLLAQQQKDGLKTGNAYNGIGIARNESGNYEEALSNYFKGLKAYESVDNEKKQAGASKNIGNVYRVLKSYDKARHYLESALEKYAKNKDSTGISGALNDIGIMYMEQDSSEQAIVFFKEVIYTYSAYAKDRVKAFVLNNLAITYSRKKSYTEAIRYYNLSLAAMQKLNDRYGTAMALSNLGSVNNKLGNFNLALKYSSQAKDISEEIAAKDLMAATYENLATSYKNLADFGRAYNFLKKMTVLKDTIFEEEKTKSYVEMEAKYQNEKKQKEIFQLQQQRIIANLALENQQRTKYLLITILVFVSVVFVLLYRNYIVKQRSNRVLNVLNARLNEANQSKTKLLGIISHDLRSPLSNLFSFLQLRKRNPGFFTKEKEEDYNKQLTASAENLLEAMEDLLIWAKSQMDSFSPVKEEINVSHFLNEIIQLNKTAAANKNIDILKECPQNIDILTDPNFLKIILRNLTSNAIKFTPAHGLIHLSAAVHANQVHITVRDNGAGIPPGDLENIFDWNSIRSDSSGLGLKLAKEFTTKLNGTLSVLSEQDKGTEFILSFPHN